MEAAGEEEEEEGAVVVEEEEEVGVEEVAVEEAVEEADGVQEVVTGEWKCVDLVRDRLLYNVLTRGERGFSNDYG